MDKFNPGWFVIYTRPRHEKKIAQALENIKVCNFLPVVKTLKTWSDRKQYVDTPLFPSYLFVRLEDIKSYFRSLDINGVLHYVRTGKQIAVVSDTVISNLKLIISNSADSIEVSSDNMYPGKILCIKEGPFTGFCCEVIRYKGKQKILVRMELLQRSILCDVAVDHLLPVSVSHEQKTSASYIQIKPAVY